MRRTVLFLMAILFFAAIAAGCGEGPSGERETAPPPVEETGPAPSSAVSSTRKEGDFAVSLTAEPRESTSGRGFSLTLTVRNLSDRPRTFDFRDAQRFDFHAYLEKNEKVWTWSSGMMFAQMLSKETFEPSGSKVYKAAWDASGQGQGTYTIQGVFLGLSHLKPGVNVVIRPGG